MRILHVVGGLNRGGAETWLVQMLAHIDREKYQMDFLVHSTEPGAYDEEVRALGSRVVTCLKPSNPLLYALNFRRILRRYGPYDCVHSHIHHYSGYVLMLAASVRVPVRIAHSHSDTSLPDRGSSALRRVYLSQMESLIRHFATRQVAVTECAARSLFSESWTSDLRCSIFPLGIDFLPFDLPVDSQQVRSELGISPDAFVVGHVGRFVELKNHRFLVEIARHFCRLEPKAVFLLVGDGPLKPEIEDLARSPGLKDRFVFTGVRTDVPRIMKGAMDCFLFPSAYEGLGLVLWEAQAAGLHCIVSDTLPKEGDVNESAVTRLSLAAAPSVWASHLTVARSSGRDSSISGSWLSTRSIEGSAGRMESLYNEAPLR
jgi:glycosyltransferase involved in cell wall biosynthesis